MFDEQELLVSSSSNLMSAATWTVPNKGRFHNIEFDHYFMRRALRIDGKEIVNRKKGSCTKKETFNINELKCTIQVEKVKDEYFLYRLSINEKTFNMWNMEHRKRFDTWELTAIVGEEWRIVLDKELLDVWANGCKVVTMREFVDDSAVTGFHVCKSYRCKIVANSSGDQMIGVTHSLYVNDELVPPVIDESCGIFKKDYTELNKVGIV